MKVTRFATGCYHITYKGRYFAARSMEYHTEGESSERAWVLFETESDHCNGLRGDGYWNHFATLADCKHAINAQCDIDAVNN